MDYIYTFFVDPKERIIQHKKISQKDWYEEMRADIGCRLIETQAVIDAPATRWWGDEEGLLKSDEERYFFKFSTLQNIDNGIRVYDHSKATKDYIKNFDSFWTPPIVWEFCGPCFFTGVTETEEGEDLASVQLPLWQFAQCIEFMHEGYQVEPSIEFISI
tara:strand:- start:3585 stop:4064 length:480 start_codon:yes stop_codon:yes gene_type:complete